MDNYVVIDFNKLDERLFEEQRQNTLMTETCRRWSELCKAVKKHENDQYGEYLDMNLQTFPVATLAVSILWMAMEDKDKSECFQRMSELLKNINKATEIDTGISVYIPSGDVDINNIITSCDRNEMQNCCKIYFSVLNTDAPVLCEFIKSIYLFVFKTTFDSKWIERQYSYAENYRIYESDYNENQHSFARPESADNRIKTEKKQESAVRAASQVATTANSRMEDKQQYNRTSSVVTAFNNKKYKSRGTARMQRWHRIKAYLIVSGIIITAVLWLILSGVKDQKNNGAALRIKTTNGEMVSVTENMEKVEWDLLFSKKVVDYQGVLETVKGFIIGFVIYRCVLIIAVFIASYLTKKNSLYEVK